MKKKLVIFDFDGTLVDTITDVGICFNEALLRCGFPTHPIEMYTHFVGGNLETVVSRLLPRECISDENIDNVKTIYRELYLSSCKPNTKPFSGIVDLLYTLQNSGVKVAIHTNKAQLLVDDLCERFFKQISFVGIWGYNPNFPSKPDAFGVNQIMEKASVLPSESVYVGDGLTDVLTSENAGIDCIYVTWGQGKPGDTESDAVKHIVNEVSELKFILC